MVDRIMSSPLYKGQFDVHFLRYFHALTEQIFKWAWTLRKTEINTYAPDFSVLFCDGMI